MTRLPARPSSLPPPRWRCLGLWLLAGLALAAQPAYRPDPAAIQRLGPGYRYPQAGWIVVHIEGQPRERGLQHGRLLAGEIADHVLCLATSRGPKAPEQAWKQVLTLVDTQFLRGFSQEQLEEMQGIAEGASAAGARFAGRPIGLLDIAAINCANELESLEAALRVSATGLETPKRMAAPAPSGRPQHCNAFAAVGPATRDGGIVFGHITMWDLYPAQFYNVWMEVAPARGHRFVMQTTPGGIQSGMDYSINDAGILMSETTLEQTAFEPRGRPLAARIRQAEQYAENIDQVVAALGQDNNGLATSEWILADLKANEIALFTLGTHRTVLHRSSKREWLPGAEGFYWSCNNDKDAAVRLETVPSLAGRPSAAAAFEPSRRDELWVELFQAAKGRIDETFARQVLTRPELVAPVAVDSKYTTTAMAGKLQSWAAFGPPAGGTRWPSPAETRDFSQCQALLRNPWTVLRPGDPGRTPGTELAADIQDPLAAVLKAPSHPPVPPAPPAAWHGTLLPLADADVWLSTAFANYERVVALGQVAGQPEAALAEQVGSELFYYRGIYEWGSRAGQDRPLTSGEGLRSLAGFQAATGKGVLLLHSLRELLGGPVFDPLMDSFGSAHAGQPVSVAQFRQHLEQGSGRKLDGFFQRWLEQPGLPRYELGAVTAVRKGQGWETTLEIGRDALGQDLPVPVTVEAGDGEVAGKVVMAHPRERLKLVTATRPERVIVDKYGTLARANGAPFTLLACEAELDQALIVVGTRDEAEANEETAAVLQQALKRREFNLLVPIRKDTEVTDAELRSHHLLVIGRPECNTLSERFRDRLPVAFGPRSFEVRGEVYANPGSAVLTALENPLNRRFEMVLLAGLGGQALLKVAARFQEEAMPYAQTLVLPCLGDEELCVLPAPELVRNLPEGTRP